MRTTLLAITAAVLVSSGAAEATDRFVSTRGDDQGGANPCTASTSPCRTIGHALAQAGSGDVIKVARGTYKGGVEIVTSGTWTIHGGYREGFDEATRDGVKNKTTVSGDQISGNVHGRFLVIHAESGDDIAVALDGLVVSNSTVDGAPPFDCCGGGIFALAEGGSIDLDLNAVTLTGDSAIRGGALALDAEAGGSIVAHINASTFKNNRADLGGAIGVEGQEDGTIDLTIGTTRFEKNRAAHGGGAVHVRAEGLPGVTATIRRSLFLKNVSDEDDGAQGGAIALLAETSDGNATSGRVELAMENSVLQGNKAARDGGAIHAETDFFGPPAPPGAPSLSLDLRNNTFVGNKAGRRGGALDLFADAPDDATGGSSTLTGTLLNNIIRGNKAAEDPESGDVMFRRQDETGVVASFTLTSNNIAADLNVDATVNETNDQLDVDPRLVKKKGILHLKPTSPMINAGTCAGAPLEDIDGDPRPDGSGLCDIGADEF